MAEIKIPISVELANALPKLKQLTGELGKVEQEAEGVITGFEHISSGANKIGDQGVKSFKAQLREANQELLVMAQRFGATSPEAAKAAEKVADLKDQIGDAKLLTDAFNPDAKFTALANALKGAVGAFSAVQGAQALFGNQSKAVEQALLKVQGAMALSQGINSILESKDAFIALGVQLGIVKKAKLAANAADAAGTVIQGANTLATEAGAVAEAELAVATTGAAGAMGVLRTALIATGIGAAVVAVGLLVANWDKVSEALGLVNKEQERYKQTVKDLGEVQKEGIKNSAEEVTKLQLLYAATQDTNLSVAKRREAVDLLQKQYPDYFKNLKDEAILAGDAKTQYDALTQSIIKKGIAQAGEKKIAEINESILESVLKTQEAETRINEIRKNGVVLQGKIQAATVGGRAVAVQEITGRSFDPKLIEERAEAIKRNYQKAYTAVEEGQARIKKIIDAVGLGNIVDNALGGDDGAKKAKEKVQTITDVLNALQEKLAGIRRVGFEFDTSTAREQIAAITETIKQIRADKKLNLQVDEQKIQDLRDKINSLELGIKLKAEIDIVNKEKLKAKRDEIQSNITAAKPIELNANLRIKGDYSAAMESASELEERFRGVSEQIAATLESGLEEAIGTFGEGLGNALSGEGDIGDALKSGLQIIGSTMQQIGKLFIQQAIAVKIFKETVFKSAPLAIAAGVALIAAGAAVKNATSKKFASGGFVSGPGSEKSDSIPAMLSNGEYVINAASVRKFGVGFFNNLNSGLLRFATGGLVAANQTMTPVISEPFGQMIPYIASTEVRGQDLRIVLNRANSRFNNSN